MIASSSSNITKKQQPRMCMCQLQTARNLAENTKFAASQINKSSLPSPLASPMDNPLCPVRAKSPTVVICPAQSEILLLN